MPIQQSTFNQRRMTMKTLQAFMLLTLLLAATHLPAAAGKVALSLATKLAIV